MKKKKKMKMKLILLKEENVVFKLNNVSLSIPAELELALAVVLFIVNKEILCQISITIMIVCSKDPFVIISRILKSFQSTEQLTSIPLPRPPASPYIS